MTGKENARQMEKIVSLCKRRGFIFQSSEIYGGLNGVWDYGPLGTELKNNLKQYWWQVMVRKRDDVVGLDGAILTHPAVLKASGHVDTFTDRSREFEQMELEYFCRPEQGMDLLAYWLKERIRFYEEIGISRKRLHVLDVPEKERAFYSKGTFDIEYEFPFGRQELEGVAYRTDYDLQQHIKASGKALHYFDEETKERFVPHVVEPSAGVDRTVLALICDAYDEDSAPDEKGKMETRIVMRFHPRMAPIKCAVFPLLKNKEVLVAKAREVQALLRPHMNVFYDEGGAIGRRYRRQDEIGTPFGVTIDFETLGEKGEEVRDTVTLRDRDSMKQERVAIKDLPQLIPSKIR